MAERLQTIEPGNHILAVYPNKDEKFNEAFAFLKEGLQRDEVIVLTTTDLPKDEIRARMRNEWKVDVTQLESRGDIIIRTTEELYFPDDIPNVQRTTALWSTLVENCLSKGKRGMRVFGDMTAFFKNGFTKELLDYESCLEQRFNFHAIGILLSLLSLLSYCSCTATAKIIRDITDILIHYNSIRNNAG